MANETNTNTQQQAGTGTPATAGQTRVVPVYDSERGMSWKEEPVPPGEQEPEHDDPDARKADDDIPNIIKRADEPDPDPVQGTSAEAAGLKVPDVGLDQLQQREVQEYLDAGLGDIVKGAGLNSVEINELVGVAVDEALADAARVPLEDKSANLAMLRRRWGGDFEKNLTVVQGVVQRIPGMSDYLDRTQLGNSPAVLEALLHYGAGTTRMSPAAAKVALDAMMNDPKSPYRRGDAAARTKARILSNIVHRGEVKAQRETVAPTRAPQANTLAAERDKLMRDPAFLDGKNPKHKAVLARYKQVTESLYPEGA